MVTLEEFQGWLDAIDDISVQIEPLAQWLQDNWVTLALTGEMIGAVVAIRMGAYRRGIGWLVAAIATLWFGWSP